ncbi:MAG: hypothetical protein J6J11_01435 [Treponema sp.]|nr:hypothetical protein [Treponema sp.]
MKRVLILLCSILIFSACNSSYDAMLDDFNSNFTQSYYEKDTMDFGDEDFDTSLMIPSEQYVMQPYYSICLSAPKGASEYRWILTWYKEDVENSKIISLARSVSYTFYDDCILGRPYIITLEAKDSAGTLFTDSAEIILYMKNEIENKDETF